MASITPEQIVAGHAKNTERHRVLLRFVREHTAPGTEPDFMDLAKQARLAGLYSVKTVPSGIAAHLALTWRRRDYWDRLADNQWRHGVVLPKETNAL